jgi:type III pantothenate kinase
MLIVIDIGNTEIVLGLYEEESLKHHWRMSSKVPRTEDEYWVLLESWMNSAHLALSKIKGVVISSVVPALTSPFIEMAKRYLHLEPIVVTAETDTGLKILYDTPRTVGADRICNAVAGYHLYKGPLIIVDFGTATTFDVVSEKGEYIGGVISLGIAGTSQELHRVATKLPKVDLIFPPKVVGNTTETSIQSGLFWGTVSMVDGMVNRIQKEMEWDQVHIIATGGLASVIVARSQVIKKTEPFLTLEGMKIIYQRNKHH